MDSTSHVYQNIFLARIHLTSNKFLTLRLGKNNSRTFQSDTMRCFQFCAYSLLILLCVACQSTEPKEDLPNIVLIITDDQGWGDLGYHGNPAIQTPHLDELAKESVRFTSFYVSPVCAPTRSSLLTGRYSLRTGVYGTNNGHATMASEEVTLAELLKAKGYRTGLFGKWHLGDNYPCRPQDQGFDYALYHRSGGMSQVGDITTYFRYDSAYFDPVLLENGNPVQKEGYCSDIFMDQAMAFIQESASKPFFAYLAFNAPHTPLQLPQKYDSMYQNLEFRAPDYPSFKRPFPKMSKKNKVDARKVYGMVSNIDDNVGKLRNQLKRLGLDENTLLIFMTDNGPQQVRYTGGFRGQKGTVYEGGTRVPFFVSYPKKQFIDSEVDQPFAHIDVVPTLVELCRLTSTAKLDGMSFLPNLAGINNEPTERPIFSYWQRGIEEPYRNIAVRKGDFKLVGQTDYRATIQDFELFNLKTDEGEMNNLIASMPEKAQELRADFDKWYSEVIQSPHIMNPPRIVIGNAAENPTILNRNDAKGNWGVWAEENIYAYWDVEVEQAGLYDITLFFEKTPNASGRALIRVGNVQRTIEVERPTQSITFKRINLPILEGMFEAIYLKGKGRQDKIFPFYVVIEKLDETSS